MGPIFRAAGVWRATSTHETFRIQRWLVSQLLPSATAPSEWVYRCLQSIMLPVFLKFLYGTHLSLAKLGIVFFAIHPQPSQTKMLFYCTLPPFFATPETHCCPEAFIYQFPGKSRNHITSKSIRLKGQVEGLNPIWSANTFKKLYIVYSGTHQGEHPRRISLDDFFHLHFPKSFQLLRAMGTSGSRDTACFSGVGTARRRADVQISPAEPVIVTVCGAAGQIGDSKFVGNFCFFSAWQKFC